MTKKMASNDIQISLAAARVNAKLTQAQVANEMHVSKSTLVSWEKGKTAPDINQAKQLCDLYQMPMNSIFFGV